LKKVVLALCLVSTFLLPVMPAWATSPSWPAPPASPRVVFVRQIDLTEVRPRQGFFGKLGRILGGGKSEEEIRRPFALHVEEGQVFLTCQDRPALVILDTAENRFWLADCKQRPLVSPIDVAWLDGTVVLSDSGSGAIYKLDGDELKLWISEGLVRPTGMVVLPGKRLLMVVDTGDHSLKYFDFEGKPVNSAGQRGETEYGLNFPTFAALDEGQILVNDTLNYQVKRYDGQGALISAFGQEGDGPGTFARPKGLAVDSDGNIWVVDALFDNIQVFNREGRLLLVIGGPGQAEGEFWSPTGISISGDEVFIADTFNNRIQVLRYIGGDS
jgi:sugar lactone lactonase YvrE